MLLEQHPSRVSRGGGALPSGRPDTKEHWDRDVINSCSLQPELLQGWLVLPGEPPATQQFPETQARCLPAQLHSPTHPKTPLLFLFYFIFF